MPARPPNNPNRRAPAQPAQPSSKPPSFDELFPLATAMKMKLKVFMYGDVGTRKTPTALTFPRPVMLDVDGGSRAYAARYPNMRIFQPRNLADLMTAVKAIKADAGRSCDTAIIDSISPIIDDLKARYLDQSRTGYLSQADYSRVNLKLKDLYNMLTDLPVHVVVIARLVDTYESQGDKGFKVSGQKFAADKSAPFNFDIVMKMTGGGKGTLERIRGLEIPTGLDNVSWDGFFKGVADKLDTGADPADISQGLGAALFTAYWRAQGLENDQIKTALGCGLAAWTKGRPEADERLAAFVEKHGIKPDAPAPAGAGWDLQTVFAEADRLGWLDDPDPYYNHHDHIKNTLTLLTRERRINQKSSNADAIAALLEYAQGKADGGPGFSQPI